MSPSPSSPSRLKPRPARNATAVLGPTNTGKTHLAIERLLAHDSGMIGLPLRLLAREVYDKVAARAGPAQVALITGEEKIKPQRPRYFICTVEAMPLEEEVDFVAIDEIQLAADGERGHVFTDRLFHARGGSETLLLGAATMRRVLANLLPDANTVSRPRLSKLSYAGQKKLSRLPRRSAIVAFSASDVYAIAELVRRQRGGAAVVLGALSPRTRNAQVELYQSGEVDFLVATDAIGMGLNLDVNHVAFAATRKFDGRQHRELSPAELAQIAGRAGRHVNDGTFGVTAKVEPFEPDLINALENHAFDDIRLLQWRNRALDFSSLDALKRSLQEAPQDKRLARSRMVDDQIALENVAHDEEVRKLAVSPAALRLLWEICQIPDYQKISAQAHAELVATLYGHLIGERGQIPEDWFAEQVKAAERTDGDIDTLANRIAHIRTWTFVSNRGEWLADAAHWQERTREIEDALSDALHERLTRRFVDRRTSALMRRMRDKEELTAEIGEDGALHVERHFVGTLSGFHFSPDTSGEGVHGKAARNAAAKVLAVELKKRADALEASADGEFTLGGGDDMLWRGAAVARLQAGDAPLNPAIRFTADENMRPEDQARVTARLERWLESHIAGLLEPIYALNRAQDISGLARGVGFQLIENFGVLKRDDVVQDIRALDQEARGQLRKYGVRFGAFNIYFPALLKPAPSQLLVRLWALRHQADAPSSSDPSELARQGLTSAPHDRAIAEQRYRIAGFHVCGNRVARIDMLERLADMIRPLVAWRGAASSAAEAAGDGAEKPAGATGDGGFEVQPDMMSLVGCSGEDFAQVLRALGFERDAKSKRRPKTPAQPPAANASDNAADDATQHGEAGGGTAAPDADQAQTASEPDVWRPKRKRRFEKRAAQTGKAVKPRRAARKGAPRRAARGRKEADGERGAKRTAREARADPDSPFAVLAELKGGMQDKLDEKV